MKWIPYDPTKVKPVKPKKINTTNETLDVGVGTSVETLDVATQTEESPPKRVYKKKKCRHDIEKSDCKSCK